MPRVSPSSGLVFQPPEIFICPMCRGNLSGDGQLMRGLCRHGSFVVLMVPFKTRREGREWRDWWAQGFVSSYCTGTPADWAAAEARREAALQARDAAEHEAAGFKCEDER